MWNYMKYFRYILLFAAVLLSWSASAQNVSNADFYQDGKNVVITYSLDQAADVSVQVSTDGGATFSTPLKHVSGHVGQNVQAGNNHIVWDVLAEYEKLVGGRFQFLITAGGRSHNSHEYVDLGLPSGTLWATCNIGATNPEDYGDYFAWGETQPKSNYDRSSYKFYNGSVGSYDKQTKYCTHKYYGYVDNKRVLDLSDDAARVNWGGEWRMPTKKEQDELWAKCTWSWTKLNGVNGFRVKGPNGKTIFLPAAGYRSNSDIYRAGEYGHYWSSSLEETRYAYSLYISTYQQTYISASRFDGHSVRPVCSSPPKKGESTCSFTVNGITFYMVKVQGGTFTMGATSEQGFEASYDEKPAHKVILSDYYIGETEVTQALWQAVMRSNPSKSWGTDKPVEYVNWNECQEFIQNLNAITGRTFRLPTEAEWEYAARGGNKSMKYKYSGSNNIDDVAWFANNSNKKTHSVATKKANELGIYDMSGNVFEWCSDWFTGVYDSSTQQNPTGPSSGSKRVRRGGSWFTPATSNRVSYRSCSSPDSHYDDLGLRLVLVP